MGAVCAPSIGVYPAMPPYAAATAAPAGKGAVPSGALAAPAGAPVGKGGAPDGALAAPPGPGTEKADVAAAAEAEAPKPKKKKRKGLFGKIAGAVGDAVKGVANLGKKAVDAVGDAVSGAADAARGVLDSKAGQFIRRAAGAVMTMVAPPVGLAITAANAAYDGIVNKDWKGVIASGAALLGGAGVISTQAAVAAQQGVSVLNAVERGDATGAIVGALGGAAGITGDPGLAEAASTVRDVARTVQQGRQVVEAVKAASDGDVGAIVPAIATAAQLAA